MVGAEAKNDRACVDARRNRYRIPLFLSHSGISGSRGRNGGVFYVVLHTTGAGARLNHCLVAYYSFETIEI
jgi:hypothetical protein